MPRRSWLFLLCEVPECNSLVRYFSPSAKVKHYFVLEREQVCFFAIQWVAQRALHNWYILDSINLMWLRICYNLKRFIDLFFLLLAIIEHVRDGSVVRALLLPDYYLVTVMLSGIKVNTTDLMSFYSVLCPFQLFMMEHFILSFHQAIVLPVNHLRKCFSHNWGWFKLKVFFVWCLVPVYYSLALQQNVALFGKVEDPFPENALAS